METIRTFGPRKNFLAHFNTPNPLHRHTSWEFIIFEQGLSVNIVNEKKYEPVGCGDVFFLGPMHIHGIQFLSEPHGHWDLYISDADLRQLCAFIDDGLYERACDPLNPICFKLNPQLLASLVKEFRNMSIFNSFENIIEKNMSTSLQAASRGLAGFLLSMYIESSFASEIHIPIWFQNFLQDLQKPEIFSQRLNKIISGYNYSYPQFIRLFKKYTGRKMIDYITELRMNYAAELLVSTDKTEIEIASLVGYDSFCFFINRFKAKFGITPRKYKIENLESNLPEIY